MPVLATATPITGKQSIFLSFYLFQGTKDYNYTIFLGTETDEYIYNR
jgi:hypothetical protein